MLIYFTVPSRGCKDCMTSYKTSMGEGKYGESLRGHDSWTPTSTSSSFRKKEYLPERA